MTTQPVLHAPEGGVAILSADRLSKRFGGLLAVDQVSFAVKRGSITGLIGPNGAGKSTVLAVLAGALRADEGRVSFLSEDVTALPTFRRARKGLVRTFQVSSEFARLTLLENLVVAAPHQRGESIRGCVLGPRAWKRQEVENTRKAWDVLRRFHMVDKANEYAGNLSGGQKRLLEIMRGLMADPQLLLLDEPMSGVNPTLAREVEERLVALREDGMTMIMVEHELSVVGRVCDHVIAMAMGKVLAEGTMGELQGNNEVVDAYLAG